MNIIQQQEALKDLSDSQIAQQMQQPSGDMPLYLVSSEAKRRADLRARFKAEQAGPPPTTTVQEDLLRSVMNAQTPPSGIAQGIGMPQQGPQGPQGPQMPPQQAGIMSGALQQPPAPQAGQMPQQFAQGGIAQGLGQGLEGAGALGAGRGPASALSHKDRRAGRAGQAQGRSRQQRRLEAGRRRAAATSSWWR